MRLILFAVLMLVGTAGTVAAQSGRGRIAIFSDAALTDSSLADVFPPHIADIYIAHVDHWGVVASQFKTVAEDGFDGIWSSETSPYLTAGGTSPNGIYIWYGACITSDIVILKVTYLLPATSSPCSRLRVVPYPDSQPKIICVGCDMAELPCDSGGSLRVNCTVPTAQTTWGRVKALYR